MSYKIKSFILGNLFTNCYVVTCEKTKKSAIIDPADQSWDVLEYIKSEHMDIEYIINTHGHADHIAGNQFIKDNFPDAKILIHPYDNIMLRDPLKNLSQFCGKTVISSMADELINEDDIISFGEIEMKVLHTPGHTQGSVSLLLNKRHIFCGDTLFASSIGRTDLPGGIYQDIILSIKNKLFILDDECNVYPGHGEITSIGKEKRYNPFFN